MESIISTERRCHVCGRETGCEVHHVMYGVSNRSKADEDGLWVYLCPDCHRGRYGVHGYDGYELNTSLKREAERVWMKHYGKTVEDFIARYGKNYL